MNGLCQPFCRTAAVFAAAIFFSFSLTAQTNLPAAPNVEALIPHPQSPVDFFRNLLAMTPVEREKFLTNRPPEIRARILDKVHEYLALDPNERELRLRATELRWYLLPLLRDAATNRPTRLANIPKDLRDLVESRLKQWDSLPAPFRQEFLDNERALRYFSYMEAKTNSNSPENKMRHAPRAEDQARWNALSENEQKKITAQFDHFFELTPDEKQKTLATLSVAERVEMEKTLKAFAKLPAAQRFQCIRAFKEFAGMNPQERAEFLENAQRWSQMSPKERQTWRDLVAQVPIWPPVPRALIMPPLPPKIPRAHPVVATNAN